MTHFSCFFNCFSMLACRWTILAIVQHLCFFSILYNKCCQIFCTSKLKLNFIEQQKFWMSECVPLKDESLRIFCRTD